MTTPTESTERTLAVETRLYYDLHVPATMPAPLLIALHGYGASKRQMMREARAIAPESFAIASLQGPHQHLKDAREPGGQLRFGFGWLTNFHTDESVALHQRALLDLIDSLVGEGLANPGKVFLLGFSQSCALNYKFAFTHPDRLRGVIGICGGIPGDWDTNPDYKETGAGLFHLTGEHDGFYPPARVSDYGDQLRRRAPDLTFQTYDAGHEITQPMRDDVRTWLAGRSGGTS